MLAPLEKKLLVRMARRIPAWIGPDHLTALGLLSLVGAGAGYWLARSEPLALVAVNVFLALNWEIGRAHV